jgi:hypothetical protein
VEPKSGSANGDAAATGSAGWAEVWASAEATEAGPNVRNERRSSTWPSYPSETLAVVKVRPEKLEQSMGESSGDPGDEVHDA